MLIALTLASRTQSIHLLDIRNMKKGYDVYRLFYRPFETVKARER